MAEKLPGRTGLLRSAVLFTPLFIASLAMTVAILIGAFDGGIILLVLGIILSILFGYQSIQALRDLRANRLSVTQGPVSRIWSKMDLFVTRSYYINVNRNIFRIPLQSYWDLREEAKRMRADGSDEENRIEVRVEHYPHTGNVIKVDRLGVVPADQPELSVGRRDEG